MAPKKLKDGATNSNSGNLTEDRAPRALLECFAPNPRNPRRSTYTQHQRLGDSMRDFGQLQAVVAVSRRAWLDRWPEDAGRIPVDAQMVTLMGSNRLLAARLAKLTYLDYTLRDDLMEHELGPLVAAAMENLDRQDFSLLDQARLCEEVALDIGESATAEQVGAKLGKGRHWVNQRRGLLRLGQRIQDAIDLRDPRITIEVARAISPIGKKLASPAEREALQLKALLDLGIDLDQSYVEEDETDDGDTAVSDIVDTTKSDTAVSPIPRARSRVKPPVISEAKLAKSIAAYVSTHDARSVGASVRAALDETRTVEAVGAMIAGLGQPHLDKLLTVVSELRSTLTSPAAE